MKYLINIWFLIGSYLVAGQLTHPTSIMTGQSLTVSCDSDDPNAMLAVRHGFGNLLLSRNESAFQIPTELTRKKGILKFELLEKGQITFSSTMIIVPDTTSQLSIEAYAGPKHLVVGIDDYSMVTSSLLDANDNPLDPNKVLLLNKLDEQGRNVSEILTDGLIGFDKVYAGTKKGHAALSLQYQHIGSKEFRLDFYANHPKDYTIEYRREHAYADGNQLINISTKDIIDQFGNEVENGTTVTFIVEDNHGKTYSATSSTILGEALVELPAPIQASQWKVTSFIAGYAESNELIIDFKNAIQEIPIHHKTDQLEIGPILSYMNQFVKEGTLVLIKLSGDNNYEWKLPIREGKITVDYKHSYVDNGVYQLSVMLGGVHSEELIEVSYE